MDDLERKARELLSEASGWNVDDMAKHLGSDVCLFTAEEALDAVRAALTPPDGYVLVPVEVRQLYEFMAITFTPFTGQHQQIKIQLDLARNAVIAARPEVP